LVREVKIMTLKGMSVCAMCGWLLAGLAGCVSFEDYEKTKLRADTAEKIVADLRRKLEQLEADYERLKAQLRTRRDVGELEDEIARLKNMIRELTDNPPVDLTRLDLRGMNGVAVNPVTGGLMLEGDVLFDSGRAVLKESFKPVLRRVAQEIKAKFPDHYIFLDGHTDRQKIDKSIRENPDNWFLGMRRAHAIMVFLRDDPECKFAQEKFVLTSPGYTQPVKGEENKIESRANRRVELRVVKEIARPERSARAGG
jgi:flagellar motor protein MotB